MHNYITMQYFEWHLPSDGSLWSQLEASVDELSALGVSGVWIPPAYKGISQADTGYGCYDLYDLGEFEQKGGVRTKYGTLEQLQSAIKALHAKGLKVYADTVLNHKAGADRTERFMAVKVADEDRELIISEPLEIEAWTAFDYEARGGQYSKFQWRAEHFTGVDYDQSRDETAVYRILGENKAFSDLVSKEFGNYDYLMFANVDYHHPEVIEESLRWGRWFIKKLDLDGLRMDAVKHIHGRFIKDFVKEMKASSERELYVVAEYWEGDTDTLAWYIEQVEGWLDLFDVSLHYRFVEAADTGAAFDLRSIFEGSLVARKPQNTMTFVDNHDSQPGQSLASFVQDWFKPLAYALILLREDGYPCLFYGDYYGIGGEEPIPGKKEMLTPLLLARRHFAYGPQEDYFVDHGHIGWLRLGDLEHENSGLAVVMSNDAPASISMRFGPARAGQRFVDLTRQIQEPVILDAEGQAVFRAEARSVSVWIQDPDPGHPVLQKF